MMKITKENYELYFIDYLDGNLSDHDIIQLENFLLLNPEYRTELEGLEKTILTPENNSYPDKDLLRKLYLTLPVNPDNFDDFCVAAVEGDLDENSTRNFKNYLDLNPDKLNDYLIYSQVKLVPEKNIVFPLKNELKKAVIIPNSRMIYYAISIAASIALVLAIVNYIGEFNKYSLNKETADFIKTESPLINPQNNPQQYKNVQAVKEKSPLIKMPVARQTSIFSVPVEKEKSPEGIVSDMDEIITEKINISELFKKVKPENEIMIPLLNGNDIIIPKSYQDINPIATNTSAPENKYLSLGEFASKEFNEKVLGKNETSSSRISLMDIAAAGIRGVNLLTGGNMKLEKKSNPNDHSEILAFESKLFGFSTKINPKE